MKNSKFICFIVIVCWALLGVGIFLNPYTNSDYLIANPGLCININSFFEKCGLGYRFSFSDVVSLVRFTQYVVFGIITTAIVKSCSKSIFKNICTPLFLGLAVALAEVYYKSFTNLKIGLYEVILSFAYFCIGLVFYIVLFGFRSSPKKGYGFKIKYGRRR